MRVGVLTSLYPTPRRPHEGVFAERRWTGMRARGHDVRVVQPLPLAPPVAWGAWGAWAEIGASPRREERGGVPVERPRYLHVPGRARGNARRFARRGVARLLADGRPEVVVCDYAWPAAAAAPLLRARGIPCVVSGRGSDVLEVAGEAGLELELASLLAAAGHWCAVSRDLLERMDELGGARGALVPNGVDLELFRPRDRRDARRTLGLPEDPELVLVVGHLIPRKDPLLALEAFRRGAPPEALLAYVGRGPLWAELESRVAGTPELAGRVRLAGEAPPEELATWYAAADLVLLASRREGRPNVVVEALAAGRPVVATDAGGTGELLEGIPGALVGGRDPDALAGAVAAALAAPGDPEVLRARVSHLTWDGSLAALEGVLAEAVAAESGGP